MRQLRTVMRSVLITIDRVSEIISTHYKLSVSVRERPLGFSSPDLTEIPALPQQIVLKLRITLRMQRIAKGQEAQFEDLAIA